MLFVASIMISTFICYIAATIACKMDTEQSYRVNEQGNLVDKEGNFIEKAPDKSEIGALVKKIKPLGKGLFVSFGIDSIFGTSDLLKEMGKSAKYFIFDDYVEFTISMVIVNAVNIISFIILFYIIYGIMSALKSNNGNEEIRRNFAGWISIAISILLCFCLYTS